MGCGDTHTGRHARRCDRNRFCYGHYRMWLDDHSGRMENADGKTLNRGPCYLIAVKDVKGNYARLREPLPMDYAFLNMDPEAVDFPEEIFEVLAASERSLTAKQIVSRLQSKRPESRMLEVTNKRVLRSIRKLGKAVSRSTTYSHLALFSYDPDGLLSDIEDYAAELDRLEAFLEAGNDIADFPFSRQEEHVR